MNKLNLYITVLLLALMLQGMVLAAQGRHVAAVIDLVAAVALIGVLGCKE